MGENPEIKIIYILGNSYSGSTMLSFLTGSNPKVEYIGEPKSYTKIKNRNCSCGEDFRSCGLWSKFDFSKTKLYRQPSLIGKLKLGVQTMLNFKSRDEIKGYGDINMLRKLRHEKHIINPSCQYFVDASKSVWRLNYLNNLEGIQVYPIFIKRDIKGSISSYIKRGKISFVKALTIYSLQNYFAEKYLKVNGIKCIKLKHELLSTDAQNQMNRIGHFLSLDYLAFNEDLKQKNFHVFTGNTSTIRHFSNGFTALAVDNSWEKILTKRQINFLNFISKAN